MYSSLLFCWCFTRKQVQLAWEVVAFSPSEGWDLFSKLGVPQHAEDRKHFCRQRRFGMYELFKFKNVYSNREPLGGRVIIRNGAERQTVYNKCSFGKLCSGRISDPSFKSLLIVALCILPNALLFFVPSLQYQSGFMMLSDLLLVCKSNHGRFFFNFLFILN